MWKFIITWCIINHIQIECEVNKPYKDEFGRTVQNNYSVYCEKIEYDCNPALRFETVNRDSAFMFYKRAKALESTMPDMGTLDSVRIDSINYLTLKQ